MGLGLLCIRASELRAEGKSIDEVASWLYEHRLTVNQECTVEKLTYFKQAGRVSATTAFFGGLLQIKPIVISDALGHNVAVEKVRGRKASIERIVERFKAEYESVPYQRIVVEHADCIEDAETLRNAIIEACPDKDIEVPILPIGPTVGATAGPGTIAVLFYGKEVTYKSEE
jgi:DegV family protein with EDD domain